MPLAPPILQSALEALFAEPPLLVAECAEAWAQAMADYAAGVVPVSTTVAAAASSLATALAAAFATPVAAPAFDAAMTAFAVTVGSGMLPAFVAVPPPAPLGVAALLAASQPTHAAAAAAFSAQIDAWFRAGSATLALSPFTVVPAWT
jgi:hypothetical protein